jgi:hypothetical protein
MFVYNVTTKVQHAIADQWLLWIKQEHIPQIIGTGCFLEATILHLSEATDEEGPTYAIQYKAPTKEHYQDFLDRFSNEMSKKSIDKWGDRVIAFRTLMEIVG